jgi:hypothetical protein
MHTSLFSNRAEIRICIVAPIRPLAITKPRRPGFVGGGSDWRAFRLTGISRNLGVLGAAFGSRGTGIDRQYPHGCPKRGEFTARI